MAPIKQSRLLSLDVFRGITIALMILVNSPGNQVSYSWIEHSAWHGCTLADLVFPFFLFIVGVSLVFSLSNALERNYSRKILLGKILKRSLIIFALGLALNAFPNHFDLASLRFLGVLQRIAICYLVASLLFISTTIRTQCSITILILLGYWVIIMFMPIPDGDEHLSQTGNLAAYLDRLLLSPAHLYQRTFDPEGVLSTLPAIATTLLGNIAGYWLRSTKNTRHVERSETSPGDPIPLGLCSAGITLSLIGWVFGLFFPINKALWTSSYVLWTGGLALLLLAFCYWTIEVKHWKKWSKPFEVFGLNAITAYLLHVFFLKVQAMIHLPLANGTQGNLRLYITEHLFGWASPLNASLFYALSYLFLWYVILYIFYRKNLFLKI